MEPTKEETTSSATLSTHETPVAVQGKKVPIIPIAIGAAIVLLIVAGLFTKGYLVAATVDGSPISRLAVIKELERQGGEQALKALVDKKLIEKGFSDKGIVIEESDVDAKITEIEGQIASQGGGTLDDALLAQGMTMADLRTQIRTQLGLEELLAEQVSVSDEDVDAYITANNIQLPDGMPLDDIKAQLADQLKQQKFAAAADAWITEITDASDITYYVQY